MLSNSEMKELSELIKSGVTEEKHSAFIRKHYLNRVTSFYNESIRKIDGLSTGFGLDVTFAGRKVTIKVWSPVKKNELSGVFNQWWDSPAKTEMVFGTPQPFNYGAFDETGVITLDGVPFTGFYGRR